MSTELTRILSPALAALLLGVAASALAADEPAAAVPDSAQASYSLGLTFGSQLKNGGLSDVLAIDQLVQGIKSGLAGEQASSADRQRVVMFMRAARDASADKNRAAAAEFLVKNAKEPGIKSTASGLQYKVLAEGDATSPSPQTADQVTVNYAGRLLNGSEFDSSYKRGAPATFSVGSLIKGWNEALTMMKPGAKWQLFVPPELAYDASPPSAAIPPGSLLIFDLELIKSSRPVMPAPAKAAAGKAGAPGGAKKAPPKKAEPAVTK